MIEMWNIKLSFTSEPYLQGVREHLETGGADQGLAFGADVIVRAVARVRILGHARGDLAVRLLGADTLCA